LARSKRCMLTWQLQYWVIEQHLLFASVPPLICFQSKCFVN